jgi:hypothetical protein
MFLPHMLIMDFIYHLWQKNYSGITNLKSIKNLQQYLRYIKLYRCIILTAVVISILALHV